MKGRVVERDAPSLTAPRSTGRSHRTAVEIQRSQADYQVNIKSCKRSTLFLQEAANVDLKKQLPADLIIFFDCSSFKGCTL